MGMKTEGFRERACDRAGESWRRRSVRNQYRTLGPLEGDARDEAVSAAFILNCEDVFSLSFLIFLLSISFGVPEREGFSHG